MTVRDDAPQDWFIRQISRGLAALISLRLEGHPAADTVDVVRKVWAQALWPTRAWDEQADTDRIGEAFRRIVQHEARWPAPSTLMRHLPERPPQPQLPPPRIDPNRLRELRYRLAGLERKLKGVPDEPHPKHDPRRKD
jgi:hypothetical protein